MPIEASVGTLDVENATLRASGLVATTNLAVGRPNLKDLNPPTLEIFSEGVPSLELHSNTLNLANSSKAFARFTASAESLVIQSGTDTANDSKGDIAFSGVNDITRYMTIKGSTGRVGIGTDDPSDALHVYGAPMVQHDTFYDTANAPGWYKIGEWSASAGARLKISFLGGNGYSSTLRERGGEAILYASCNNNFNSSSIANINGSIHAHGKPVVTQVKFEHINSSRYEFAIYAYVQSYSRMSMTVECNVTTSFTKFFTTSSDPGAESATVSHAIFTHVVDNDGNVGIGKTDPGSTLDVNGVLTVQDAIRPKYYSSRYYGTFSSQNVNFGYGMFNLGSTGMPHIGWEVHINFRPSTAGSNVKLYGAYDSSGTLYALSESRTWELQEDATSLVHLGQTPFLLPDAHNNNASYYAVIRISNSYGVNFSSGDTRLMVHWECMGIRLNVGSSLVKGIGNLIFSTESRRLSQLRLVTSEGTITGEYVIMPIHTE